MGNYQTKDNVAVAQAQINSGTAVDLHQKVNTMSLVLIVLATIIVGALLYGIRMQCHRRARSWLRKEMRSSNASVLPTVVRVPAAPQPAAPTVQQGYV